MSLVVTDYIKGRTWAYRRSRRGEEGQIEYDKTEEHQERGIVEGRRVGMKGRMRSPVEEGYNCIL